MKELFHSGLLLPQHHIPRNVSLISSRSLAVAKAPPFCIWNSLQLLTLDFGMKRKMQSRFSKYLSCSNFTKNGTQRLEILLTESYISLGWKGSLKIIQSNPSATSQSNYFSQVFSAVFFLHFPLQMSGGILSFLPRKNCVI